VDLNAFNLDSQANVVGDIIYFSPLFHLKMKENRFKLDNRVYPIDYTYPWHEQYTISVMIPEGYTLIAKADDINVVLAENVGGFMCKIIDNGKNLQLVVDLKINKAVLSTEYSADLKELFKIAVEKQTEKVVLSKISSNGTADSSGKGR
jgi:hypothetical protein